MSRGPHRSNGKNQSEFRTRLERIRIAREVDDIRDAADVFLKHHQLPDDLDILHKVLLHPSEKVVREALGQISSLITQGRTSGSPTLDDRLHGIAERAQESSTRSFVDGIRAQLAAAKR